MSSTAQAAEHVLILVDRTPPSVSRPIDAAAMDHALAAREERPVDTDEDVVVCVGSDKVVEDGE